MAASISPAGWTPIRRISGHHAQPRTAQPGQRKGKAPGGYQATLDEARLPFIFMNAVGVDGDVRTLLHEAGHAFHVFATQKRLWATIATGRLNSAKWLL